MKNKMLAKRVVAAAVGIMVMAGICVGQSYWKKTYERNFASGAKAITSTPDGNFMVAGYTYVPSSGGYSSDFYLLKIKPDGDTIWTKTYLGEYAGQPIAITSTQDGNFIIASETWGYVYLFKIKPNADTIWTKTYLGNGVAAANAITPTSDGNFMVAGYTNYSSPITNEVYLLKIKPSGDTIWTKTYGGNYPVQANAISPTPDGNFIIAGNTGFNNGGTEAYLLKINPNGDIIWTKTYLGNGAAAANAIAQTPDGNFMAAGYSYSASAPNKDVYLLKIKPDGDTLFTKTFGGTSWDVADAVAVSLDGNLFVTGCTTSFGAGSEDIYLLKITINGDTLWTKTIGERGNDWGHAITLTPDGNFIVAAETDHFSSSHNYVYIISVIDDRYAYKNSLFTFKIPVYDTDSLNHGYTPLKIPSGMTVSLGGTISWTPTTDSSYMDHVEFLVSDDFGKKDTLTFNIFVNSKDYPTKVIKPTSSFSCQTHQSGISISTFSSSISFFHPVPTGSLAIYDIHGRLIQNLSFTNNTAFWRGKIPAGRYFAKMTDGERDVVKGFTVIK